MRLNLRKINLQNHETNIVHRIDFDKIHAHNDQWIGRGEIG